MQFDRTEWLGEWENFELYFTSSAPEMQKAWKLAEQAVREQKKNLISAVLFRKGAMAFWQSACYTQTPASPLRLGGWHIVPTDGDAIQITWFDDAHRTLGAWRYSLDSVLEKGLEGKPNFLLCAQDAAPDCPYRFLLTMVPMPERSAKEQGRLISHLHFQFAAQKAQLIKPNGKLCSPHWYATMCDGEATLLQKCNIVLALHKLPTWEKLEPQK